MPGAGETTGVGAGWAGGAGGAGGHRWLKQIFIEH